MLIRFNKVGAVGVIKDLEPISLPPEAWSDGYNVRFEGKYAEKIKGHERIYNISIGASTVTQALAISPWFVMQVETRDDVFFLYAGKTDIYGANQVGNNYRMTRGTATGSTSGYLSYSATPSVRWNGGILSGLPILNNSIDVPQVMVSVSASGRFMNLQWDASASSGSPISWLSASGGAVYCQVLRTYRDFAIAINLTEGTNAYPRRLRWSHPAVPGSAPRTWDETRETLDAGYKDFDETTDPVIDGIPLRDSFLVYKEQSVWNMQYTGGIFVHQFRRLFDNFGMIAPNCGVDIGGRHVVLTTNDVVMHDGQSYQSIIEDRWRDYLFSNIELSYYRNCFLTRDLENEEVWICFPSKSATEPFWVSDALIWNWRDNTWVHRALGKAAHIIYAKTLFGNSDTGGIYTWATDPYKWSTNPDTWGESRLLPPQMDLVSAYPEDLSGNGTSTPTLLTSSSLLRLNSTDQFNGVDFDSYLVRESMTLAGQDMYGQKTVDLQDYKHVKRIWPHIEAPDGTEINITVGTQRRPGDPIEWGETQVYTVGTSEFVNHRAMGRLISVKFQNKSSDNWKLTSYDIEFDLAGRF